MIKSAMMALCAFLCIGLAGNANADDHGNKEMMEKPAMSAPVVGEKAPVFTAVDSNGVTHSLSDFMGKTVVLEWTNHQCPFVKKHYDNGDMQALQKEAGDDVVWLSIVSSAPGNQGHVTGEEANEQTKLRDAAPTAVILDPSGEVGKMYDAKTTPHMFVIDASGTLVYAGAIDDNNSANPADVPTANNYVRAALNSLKAGEAIAVSQTQAYGCSVKY